MDALAGPPGKTILLVDDDETVRKSLRLLLSIDAHKVTEAESGRQALQLFRNSNYDVVITDYLMPAMLGDELARNIKRIAPRQHILILTGYAERFKESAISADVVLGKPIDVEDLRDAIGKWS